MKKVVLFMTIALSVIFLIGLNTKVGKRVMNNAETSLNSIEASLQVQRLQKVTANKIEKALFEEVLPDEVVRKIVRRVLIDARGNMRGKTYVGRELVYRHYVTPTYQSPLGHLTSSLMGDDGYGVDSSQVWDACYGAFTGYPNHTVYWGITMPMAEEMRNFRSKLIAKGRYYLKDPSNLVNFYNARRDVIEDEIGKISNEQKMYAEDGILEMKHSFLAFLNRNTPQESDPLDLMKLVEDCNVQELRNLGMDYDFADEIKFVHRRWMDAGSEDCGDELLLAYVKICDDALTFF